MKYYLSSKTLNHKYRTNLTKPEKSKNKEFITKKSKLQHQEINDEINSLIRRHSDGREINPPPPSKEVKFCPSFTPPTPFQQYLKKRKFNQTSLTGHVVKTTKRINIDLTGRKENYGNIQLSHKKIEKQKAFFEGVQTMERDEIEREREARKEEEKKERNDSFSKEIPLKLASKRKLIKLENYLDFENETPQDSLNSHHSKTFKSCKFETSNQSQSKNSLENDDILDNFFKLHLNP